MPKLPINQKDDEAVKLIDVDRVKDDKTVVTGGLIL